MTIFCLGSNYGRHMAEMKSKSSTYPVFFVKPDTALAFNGDSVRFPSFSNALSHEVELVAVIGRRCKDVSSDDAYDFIKGYRLGLDLTLRDIQKVAKTEGKPWLTAKGFDGSAPVSDFIPKSFVEDPMNLTLTLSVNGTERQRGSTSEMIISLGEIVSSLSSFFTLKEDDMIFTGTPDGVGLLERGDVVKASIENIVSLEIKIV